MVLRRIEWLIEKDNLLDYTMTGFRRNVSAQDTMLRLYHDVLENVKRTHTRIVVGVDVRKAFDTVAHHPLIEKTKDLGLSPRTIRYITKFLKERYVNIKIGNYTSPTYKLTAGVPQGAILSPTLFNIAMKDLPPLLHQITHLKFALYADDITLWCTHGSPGEQEQTLQSGLDTIKDYLDGLGMECSPGKTEYVVVMNSNTENSQEIRDLITLTIDGHSIPRKESIRILGFYIDQNAGGTTWFKHTLHQCHQITRMLNRIGRRKHGLKEHEGRKVVEALLISRIMYGLPYHRLTKAQHSRLEATVRIAIRTITGIPRFAPSRLIDQMGVLNTLEERIPIHRDAQNQRLQTSQQGRRILQEYQNTTNLPPLPKNPPPWETLITCGYRPLPKNMGQNNTERRQLRAKWLEDHHTPLTIYTDAAFDPETKQGAIAVVRDDGHYTRKYENCTSAAALETEAIVAAIETYHSNTGNDRHTLHIRTDSKRAIRNFRWNETTNHMRESMQRCRSNNSEINILLEWVPAHQGTGGNELAHQLARDALTNPEASTLSPWPQEYSPLEQRKESQANQRARLKALRSSRRSLQSPSKIFSRHEASLIRRAQTGTLMSPDNTHYTLRLPGKPKCTNCDASPTTQHVLWDCPNSRQATSFYISTLPIRLHPASWEEWVAPQTGTYDDRKAIWATLVQRIQAEPLLATIPHGI